jgi:hypothetical protein
MTEPDWQAEMLRRLGDDRPRPPRAEDPGPPAPAPPPRQGPPPARPRPGPPPSHPPVPPVPPPGPPVPPVGRPEEDGLLRSIGRFASQAAQTFGGSGQIRRDVENVAAVRRPLPISRLVGVLSPVAEGGTSTVAALLADTLAAQRADRILVVDADPGEAELTRRLHVPSGQVTLVSAAATVAGVRSALSGDQGTAARNFGLVLVDCPGGMTSEVSAWVGTTGHAFVVSLPSVPEVARHCLAELDRMSPDGQQLLMRRTVFAVCVVRPDDADRTGWLGAELGRRGLRSVVLPYDPELVATAPLRPDRLRPATLRATLALGARVVDLCAFGGLSE